MEPHRGWVQLDVPLKQPPTKRVVCGFICGGWDNTQIAMTPNFALERTQFQSKLQRHLRDFRRATTSLRSSNKVTLIACDLMR